MRKINVKPEQVHKEVELMAEMDHPFVLGIDQYFEDDGHHYLVLPYCPNRTLGDLRTRIGYQKIPPSLWKYYICQIVLAMEYLHKKQKVIYRDLKPENILLDDEMNIKLCDFGLATKSNDAD